MTKNELITAVAERASLSKSETDRFLTALLETITDALRNGETVPLVGFGTFEPTLREPRIGKNPRTGNSVNIPGKRIVSFRMGSNLKAHINA